MIPVINISFVNVLAMFTAENEYKNLLRAIEKPKQTNFYSPLHRVFNFFILIIIT